MHSLRFAFALPLAALLATPASGLDVAAKDTLAPAAGANPKQAEFLRQSGWKPEAFTFVIEDRAKPGVHESEAQVFFPSPKPSGNAKRDRVTALWYKARGPDGKPLKEDAPVVVVVHSLHPEMIDGLVLARLLAKNGVHALMVELPGYGERKTEKKKGTGVEMAEHAGQAVADVRRARDVAALLPGVRKGAPVALEGLSLGGLVASAAAGLDGAFSPVVVVVSGGDPVTVLEKGGFDALWLRQRLAREGYAGDRLHALLDPLDPLAVAARIDPKRCWMWRATADGVFPKECGDRLAQTIGVAQDHVTFKHGNHYSSLFWLPEIAQFMAERMAEKAK